MSNLFDQDGKRDPKPESNVKMPTGNGTIEGILKKIPIQTPEGMDMTYLLFREPESKLVGADGQPQGQWAVVMSFAPELLGNINMEGRVKLTLKVERLPLKDGDLEILNAGPQAGENAG
jgi:hypothetical protein